jgi:hypothetical protein
VLVGCWCFGGWGGRGASSQQAASSAGMQRQRGQQAAGLAAAGRQEPVCISHTRRVTYFSQSVYLLTCCPTLLPHRHSTGAAIKPANLASMTAGHTKTAAHNLSQSPASSVPLPRPPPQYLPPASAKGRTFGPAQN